uniref:Complementary sex determiner n=1 Tax=Parastrongyloides trichosuri TaxID=131310 RepID=A0A0N4ZGP8_PARTI
MVIHTLPLSVKKHDVNSSIFNNQNNETNHKESEDIKKMNMPLIEGYLYPYPDYYGDYNPYVVPEVVPPYYY